MRHKAILNEANKDALMMKGFSSFLYRAVCETLKNCFKQLFSSVFNNHKKTIALHSCLMNLQRFQMRFVYRKRRDFEIYPVMTQKHSRKISIAYIVSARAFMMKKSRSLSFMNLLFLKSTLLNFGWKFSCCRCCPSKQFFHEMKICRDIRNLRCERCK